MGYTHIGVLSLYIFLAVTFFSLPAMSQANTEEEVREYFKDTPVMINIASCESEFRQFDGNGLPLRGGWGGAMIGVFQFYEAIHGGAAASLGFDLATLEGNLDYAQHLYDQSGTAPWNSAKSCWGKMSMEISEDAAGTDVDALNEKISTLKKLVAELERLLAKKRAV